MTPPVILDAAGLDALTRRPLPDHVHGLLTTTVLRGAVVLAPAIVCAEAMRGRARTRAIDAALARHLPGGRGPRIVVVPTDLALARQVGAILHATGRTSADMVDAHVVATAVPYGGAVILTSDPDAINALATAVPGTRVVARPVG